MNRSDRKLRPPRFRKLALESIDRAVLRTTGGTAEGIGHQMDLAPEYRLSNLLVQKGDVMLDIGN